MESVLIHSYRFKCQIFSRSYYLLKDSVQKKIACSSRFLGIFKIAMFTVQLRGFKSKSVLLECLRLAFISSVVKLIADKIILFFNLNRSDCIRIQILLCLNFPDNVYFCILYSCELKIISWILYPYLLLHVVFMCTENYFINSISIFTSACCIHVNWKLLHEFYIHTYNKLLG